MKEIRIAVSGNRLGDGQRWVTGRHRWEALWLACLVQARGQPVSAARVMVSLYQHGQRTPLNRTGVRRVVIGTGRLLDELLGAGSFAKRVFCAPRTLTVGPWRFRAPLDEEWLIDTGSFVAFEVEAPSLQDRSSALRAGPEALIGPAPIVSVVSGDAFDTLFQPLELVFSADALSMSGQLQQAAELLLQALASPDLSPEMRCVVQLRLARVLKRRGEYDDALEWTRATASRASQPGFRDPGLKVLAQQLGRRIRYDREPNRFRSLGVDPLQATISVLPDLRGLCEAENLAALTARRRAMEAAKEGDLDTGRRDLQMAWALCQSALYWATSLRDHENAENVIFNMGLVLASMQDLGALPSLVPVVKAYLLGLLLRDNFDLGQDSVWDHIFIGNLWFEHPKRRGDFEDALGLERAKLSEPRFYLDALAQAERVGEERQIALCCLNVWRIAEQATPIEVADALRQAALRRLRELLRGRQDLEATLRGDAGALLDRVLGAAGDA